MRKDLKNAGWGLVISFLVMCVMAPVCGGSALVFEWMQEYGSTAAKLIVLVTTVLLAGAISGVVLNRYYDWFDG